MKKAILFFLTILPFFVFAQTTDSVTIKQIDSLIKVSRTLTDNNDFEKALEINATAEKMALEKLGRETVSYESTCFNHGRIMHIKSNYPEAEKWYLLSKTICEKTFGKDHIDYARSVIALGTLNWHMGHNEKALPLYFEAKEILEKTFRKDHPNYSACLIGIANVYSDLGQFENVEPLYLEVKAIKEKITGKNHRDYALIVHNLAWLYTRMEKYDKAEPLFLEALATWEKVVGKEHPFYARSLNSMARMYVSMGQLKKAEMLQLESKGILEKAYGKGHRDYAMSLLFLARIYLFMGQYEKAEPLQIESKGILEKVLGKDHLEYAYCQMWQGFLYKLMGQYDKADSLFTCYNKRMQENIVETLYEMSLSEKEMNEYLLSIAEDVDYLFSLMQISANETGISKTGYDNILFYKSFLLNASLHSKKLILSNPLANEKNNLLKSYRRLLAVEYAKPVAERKGVIELEEKSNTLEKEIARIAVGYNQAMKQVKWQEVQQNLKAGEAAIEFVHYRYFTNKPTDSIMYAALLLKPGEKQPQFITLFEERSLDSLLQSNNGLKADYVNELYTLAGRGVKIKRHGSRSLFEIVWKPLEHALEGIKTIYFSPNGLLYRINLDAIPVSETETLADKYQLIELNSTRQLIAGKEKNTLNANSVLYGGINFDVSGDSATRGGVWNYLPGTEREVNVLETIMQRAGFKTSLKKGSDATEESFKQIGANNTASPRIVHIATHGYFFPDPKETAGSQLTFNEKKIVFQISDHPMLRSGLILSGGNKGWEGNRTLEEKEDGVLTAYEISQMNLANTELVVLSACETGLGTIQGNEGVYGLQRAFKIAGAKYLIMSLWQVPDKQTSLLMTTFYKKWLEEKMTIPDAFHAAQKSLRDASLDPYYWAGFVLVE